MDPKASPYILALGSVWGLNLVISRFGLREFEPTIFVGLRFAIALIIFGAIYVFSARRRWSRDPRLWRNVPIVAILSGVLLLGETITVGIVVGMVLIYKYIHYTFR